jgi:hypothetical protein
MMKATIDLKRLKRMEAKLKRAQRALRKIRREANREAIMDTDNVKAWVRFGLAEPRKDGDVKYLVVFGNKRCPKDFTQ